MITRDLSRDNATCRDSIGPDLTYSQLTDYYNELVLQLRLAEHNLNVAIDLEVKETTRNQSLKRERRIVTLLNESILPALELTVSLKAMQANLATVYSQGFSETDHMQCVQGVIFIQIKYHNS